MKRTIGFIAIGWLMGMSSVGHAQGKRPPQTPLDPVATFRGDRAYWKLVSGAPGPSYLVWWADNQIKAQSYDSTGRALWPSSGTVVVSGQLSSGGWDAFADATGQLVIAYLQKGHAHVQSFSLKGQPLWPIQKTVISVLSDDVTSIVGASDSKGLYVVWSVEKGPTSILWSQRLDASGVRLWNPKGVEVAPGETDQRRPAIQRDGRGGLLVAWKGYRDQISRIRLQRIDSLGSRMWGTLGVNVISPAGDLNQKPLFIGVGDGSAVVTWTQGVDVQNQVVLQTVDADGKRVWEPEGKPLLLTTTQKWNPVLSGDQEGGAWIGWENLFEQSGSAVMATKLNVSTAPFSAGAVPLTDPLNANQGRLFIAPDGAHGIWAVWVDNRSSGVGLYAQRVDALGRRMLGPNGWTIREKVQSPQRPQLVEVAPNRAAAAWASERGEKNWELFYLQFSPQIVQEPVSSTGK